MILDERKKMKAGVSLVTVLLFMLVATIAATATFKWLTSEGRSSGARLQKQSAYQSSIAGIENARSWMTYHANDVGALIKAYIDGGNKPVNIDARLRPLQKPGQNYHVWLTGVNTEKSTYKLKIFSSGEANGGAKHSEIAIFNVDGLYRVNVPVEHHHSPTAFEYAYFGGGVSGTGTNYESAVINGNWGANPPNTKKNWIVTGNATLSGSMINVGKTSCIGGNLNANNGITTKNLFVGGDVTGTALYVQVGSTTNPDSAGDAYIGGNMVVGNQPVSFSRHLTMLGKIKTNPSAAQFSVGGNLCAGENATLIHKHNLGVGGTNTRQTVVKGNAWMPGAYNIWFKDIVCTSGKMKSCICDVNGTDRICDEFGMYNYQQYKVKSCTEVPANCIFNNQNGNPKCHCTQFKISAPLPANKYNFGDESYDADNYESYNYLWNGANKGGILLGESSGSKVYVKSGRSWSDLNAKATTKFQEKTDHPRECKDGYNAWAQNFTGHICGNRHTVGGTNNHYENWNNEEYSPYADYVNAKTNKPASLYHIYYMPEGVKDVDFGIYSDSYFQWCTKAEEKAGGWWSWTRDTYCTAWEEDTKMYGYFVNAPTNTKPYVFTNSGHSNSDGEHPVNVSGKGYYRYLNNSGAEITGSPWCKIADDQTWRPVCGVGPYFASNGDVEHEMPIDTDPSEWPAAGQPFECAESVKETCDNIWVHTTGCDDAPYKVPDALVTARESFEPYANKGCAAEITAWNSGMVEKLNNCYNNHKNDSVYVNQNFYNGYVVVKLTTVSGNGFTGTLNGKFIIIVDEQINAQNGIITAGEDSYIFLYLTKGASYLQGTANNLFIYSTGPFTETSKMHLTGTIYTPADSCIRVRFENADLKYSPELVAELTASAVICDNDGSACGGTVASSSSAAASSASESAPGGLDYYYISMAPQLGVTLESQYENNETIPSGQENQTELTPSFIVLPRIIYLPNDPYGYLSDYYSVLPLNGSTLKKTDLSSVMCSPSLNTSAKLYEPSGSTLTQGIYQCVAKASGHPDVPFWVKVGGPKRGTPTVSFVEASQDMPVSGSAEVHVSIDPHAEPITITTTCPSAPTGWSYTPTAGTDNKCTFEIPANAETEVRKLFDVTTTDASNGTLSFILMPGEGYLIGNAYAELHVSSTATLRRTEASSTEIEAYCHEHSGVCPSDVSSWPTMGCDGSGVWVRPTGSYGNVTPNNVWTVPVGGTGTVTLEAVPEEGCVVIIPSSSNSYALSALEKDHEYTLRASVFAQKKTLRVGFAGDPGTGKVPVIKVIIGESVERECSYDSPTDEDNPHYCSYDVFAGESVTLQVVDDSESDKFSFWQCESGNCPNNEPLRNKNYGTFTVSGSYDYVAHFGVSDKHCFFDEFKDGSVPTRVNRANVECLDGSSEYCIDFCGSTCVSAVTEQNVKWRLLRGNISDISYSQSYGHISAKGSVNKGKKDSNREGIVVMSTVKAGLEGTMKALVQLPKASSHGYESKAIRNSGFILHSNSTASLYLMLNLYVNSSGNLEAQVCRYTDGEYNNCHRHELKDGNDNSASVDVSSMVMVSAELSGIHLNVAAFTGNYYSSSPKQYSHQFDISAYDYNVRTNEYVGFSLADQNFKIHGIGWKSDDYISECHDTYPVVKCSFSAVAKGGVVKTDTNVTPWIGHSGWFDRASYSCTETFYYYNGSDAGCGDAGNEGVDCGSYYRFSTSGAGAHGYRANNKDMKTAKAWLNCSSSDPEAAPWTVASEAERAHCGYFWTGTYSECANDAVLVSNDVTISGGTGQSIPFEGGSFANLRKAKLNVVIENDNSSEVEVWLYSENDGDGCWGQCDPFESQSVRMTSNSAQFDVVSTFVADSSGFNPEKVKGIVVKNHGSSYITVKSVISDCENAIGISGCSATFSSGSWNITANVKNKDNIESAAYKAEVDGVELFSETKDCKNGECLGEGTTLAFTQPDNPYQSNQGKNYEFSVSISGNGGRSSHTMNSCSVSPATIGTLTASCELDGVKAGTPPTKEQGKGLPTFKATFSGECPTGGCGYRMTLDGDEFANTNGTGTVSHTPSGNTELAAPYAYAVDGEHTYRLESTNTSHPFTPDASCVQTFKIVEKELDPVGLTCSIAIANPKVSSVRTIAASQVTATNCETGCTYIITEGSTTIVPSTTYDEDADITFTSPSEAGKHNYTLTVKRTSDGKTKSCLFSETYPLDVTCGIDDVGSEENPHDPEIAVSVTPLDVQGCNSNCNYTITGGTSPSPSSGSSYDGSSVAFTDAGASGEKDYTLTIKHAGVSDAACGFKVTYAIASSSSEESSSSVASSSSAGGCECTCGDCGAIVVGTNVGVSQNSNGSVVCAFGKTITNVNTNGRTVIINGSEVSSYCLNWTGGDNPCATVYSGITKKDGGYYMEIPAGGWINATVSGATSNPCAGGGSGVSSSSAAVASSSSAGGGSSLPLTTTYRSYTAGTTYTLKTGTVGGGNGPNVMHCKVNTQDTSNDRNVGTLSEISCTIKIPSNNFESNGNGCTVESNTTYTFVVPSTAPSDLTCGLRW